MSATQLDYLIDTYKQHGEGKVVRVGEADRGRYVVLDRTIFYPQGGGQPSDKGTIEIEADSLQVTHVGFENGEVLHFVDGLPNPADKIVGATCKLAIDLRRRLSNAKLHTGGHVIAGIIDEGYPGLRATKGYHFPDGPHVEFEGTVPGDPEAFMIEVQNKLARLVEGNGSVVAEEVSYDELKSRCPNIPSYLPKDKPLRIVTISGLPPLPCGGTHVASLLEVGPLVITRIKTKKGVTKVSYGHE